MNRNINLHLSVLSAVMSVFLVMSGIGHADTLSEGHRKVSGEVAHVKGNIVTVKTPTGPLTLNQKGAAQHGHAAYKQGDEVTLVMDENNNII